MTLDQYIRRVNSAVLLRRLVFKNALLANSTSRMAVIIKCDLKFGKKLLNLDLNLKPLVGFIQ